MFYAQSENKYITEGNAFTLLGIQYPPNWLNLSTLDEKADIGLEEVTTVNTPADDKYYWVSEQLDKATLTYVNIPKDLDLLKEQFIISTKAQVYTILQPTDYAEIRNLKDPTYKPDLIEWRENTRVYGAAVIENIKACVSVDELKSVIDNVSWPELVHAPMEA